MYRLIALAGTIGISFSAIFVRLADVSPTTAAVFRTGYALPALYLVYRATRAGDHRPASARRLAFASGLLLAVDLAAWHASIGLVGAGIATLMANLQVPLVGLAAWAAYRERPTVTAFAMVPVALVGVALLSGLGRDEAYGTDPVAGVLLGMLAAAAYAAFLLVFRQSNRGHLAPAAGPLFDATAGAFAGSLVAAVFDAGFSVRPTWPSHGWLILLALGSQVASWLLITHALARLAALETSALLLAQPAATMVWALLLFDETPSGLQWAGAVLVFAAIGITATRGAVRTGVTPRSGAGRGST
jgi:drug/metabolite transporter (DMT)-like permease